MQIAYLLLYKLYEFYGNSVKLSRNRPSITVETIAVYKNRFTC